MLKNIFTLFSLNLKELVREKYLQGLIVFAILLLILSSLLGLLSFDEKRRILFHLGIFSIQICTYLSAMIFGSINLVRDVREQTFQIILARPVSRFQFLISKFLSGFFLLLLVPVVLGTLLYALLSFQLSFVGYFQNIAGIVLEAWILFGFALFISTVTRPALSFLLTGVFYLAGHWRDDLNYFAKKSHEVSWIILSSIFDYIIPPLNALDLNAIQWVDQGIWDQQFLLGSGVILLWILLFIFAAQLSWRGRDLV